MKHVTGTSGVRRGAATPISQPNAPEALTVAAQSGRTITLRWDPPGTGPIPTGYLIEGGLAPGDVRASIPSASQMPTATLDAPAGTFYVRVHAVIDGVRGPASNEIRIFIDVPALPSPPANLLGLVNGSNLALSWSNTFAGGEPTSLVLRVSGAITAELPLPLSETFTYAGVPPGTYTLSIVAANSSGTSTASNSVTLSFPGGCTGPPGPPTAFHAWQVGSTLSVSWRPPASGPAVTSYVVKVSGVVVGTVETTGRSLSGTVGSGHYAVSVAARNGCGQGPAAPAAPEWTTVIRQGVNQVVLWADTAGSAGYRVYWSTSLQALESPDAAVAFVEATDTPVVLSVSDPGAPLYYRVFGLHGPVAGSGGPVAIASTFDVVHYDNWPANVTPALWDINGDGCLDLVGGWGTCDGRFQRYPLAAIGLEGLAAVDRVNRDSRFADFTGDGIVDIFTNVYARADEPASPAMLHVGRAQGGFVEDPDMASMQLRGFGETVLAADFDNDGDLDIFVPNYTHRDDGGRNWLLVNDGTGRFTDVAQSAGVATNLHAPPEGAQAIDFNEDGWIDIHVASHLYINNGNLTFTDRAAEFGLPIRFDEGMRLFDADLDGDFDLVHHDSYVTRLHRNDNGRFDAGEEVDGIPAGATFGYGLNVCDINGDGFEDVLVANNTTTSINGQPRLLINVGGRLLRSDLAAAPPVYNDLLACADVDGSGLPDMIGRWTEEAPRPTPAQPVRNVRFRNLVNRGASDSMMRLRIVEHDGARNQQGRVVRIRPLGGPDRTMLRVVESGSGYMAQNGYDLLVAAPWPGEYEVAVRFPGGWVRTTARAGAALTIHAHGAIVPGLR